MENKILTPEAVFTSAPEDSYLEEPAAAIGL